MVKFLFNYGIAVLCIAFLAYFFFFVCMPRVVNRYKAYVIKRREYDKEFQTINEPGTPHD